MPLPALQFPPASWPGGRYSFLLVTLVLMFAVDPLVRGSLAARVTLDLFTALVFISGACALGDRKTPWLVVALIIGAELVGIALGWSWDAHGSLGGGWGGALRSIAAVGFCGYMASMIMRDVFRAERVSGDAICGAMCVYLLLGLLWAYVYLLIAHQEPGAFQLGDKLLAVTSTADAREGFSVLIYFSFATLTTLGFGDISPVGACARTACWLEAITGQLFLATFVAGLVGTHIAHRLGQHRVDK